MEGNRRYTVFCMMYESKTMERLRMEKKTYSACNLPLLKIFVTHVIIGASQGSVPLNSARNK